MTKKRLSTEERKIEKYFFCIDHKVSKAIRQYELIADGDRVLVALSGGKDSMALLEALGRRKRIFSPNFEVVAAHVVMTNVPYAVEVDYLADIAALYDIPFEVIETSFDLRKERKKPVCFLCSWMRRKALFDYAKRMQCNKIALGHHQDDILETLLMNLTFQGAFSTMPPLLKMDKFDMTLIRPLCLIREKEIAELASLRQYKPLKVDCPHETQSHRADMKQLLQQLELMNPEVYGSLWNSTTNVQAQYLPLNVKKNL